MRFDIVTIFPGLFAGMFEHGIVRRAQQGGLLQINLHDLRDWTEDRHRTVDDRPFGGGEGMVLKPEPLSRALESLHCTPKPSGNAQAVPGRPHVLLLSAQGRTLTQTRVRQLAKMEQIVMICGRYEGIDERIVDLYCDEELSIGDYVLSGGELAAAIVLDSVMRLVPGVLGNEKSGEYESFGSADTDPVEGEAPRSQHGSGGLLDYPHYTRPPEFAGVKVPDVLMGGDHAAIRRWRRQQSLRKTLLNRPDLLEKADLSKDDKKMLSQLKDETKRN